MFQLEHLDDNQIWRAENMESVHDDSESDESKTDEDDQMMKKLMSKKVRILKCVSR